MLVVIMMQPTKISRSFNRCKQDQRLTRQRLRVQNYQGWDWDMQRIQDAGYAVKDSKEIFHGAGTYSYSNSTSRIRKQYY